jgi:23S rRNA pseudouridine1911/1915/1917 synthase
LPSRQSGGDTIISPESISEQPQGEDHSQRVEHIVPDHMAGLRFDKVVAELVPAYSRARLQDWIRQGRITLDGATAATRQRVEAGQQVVAHLPDADTGAADETTAPESMEIDVHYEDEHVLVINKPAGLVMHTAPGNYSGTLQNGLLHYDPGLASIPRAGIVHRLDKDTSGLVMIARNLPAHNELVRQLQDRSVHRIYDAVVIGVPVAGATIDEPIGRHRVDRKRMAITESGKPAITHYRIAEKFAKHCHIRVKLETGRTHQIRVHMAHVRHALVGDAVYGGRRQIPAIGEAAKLAVTQFPRQALNATELGIVHPASGEEMRWQIPLPQDIADLLDALRAES